MTFDGNQWLRDLARKTPAATAEDETPRPPARGSGEGGPRGFPPARPQPTGNDWLHAAFDAVRGYDLDAYDEMELRLNADGTIP